MCVKKIDGGKKVLPQDSSANDVDMTSEDMQTVTTEVGTTGKWSLFCSLSPLGERLLCDAVS